MSRAIVTLTTAWDAAIAEHGGRPAAGSQAAFVQERLPAVGVDRRLARAPADIAILTSATVIQVARSLAALYAVSDSWGLTLGHLPLVRTILEGAGRVRWVIVGAGAIDARVAVDDEVEAVRVARLRVARASLMHAAGLEQAQRDFTKQREVDIARTMKANLIEWRELTRTAFTLRVDRARWNTWSIGGVEVPGLGDLAEAGFDLAWWPSKPDGRSLYGWLSAVSHAHVYPLTSQLAPDTWNGQPVHRVVPDAVELTAGGLVGALAVMRMMDLTFAYLGWFSEPVNDVARTLALVHALVKARTPADDGDEDVEGSGAG